jgi:cbb3-type cytochrome oxidase maturation protein
MSFAGPEGTLLAVWIAFAVAGVAGLIAVLVWAVRARQFADQDRAARLPLDSRTPDDHHVQT